MGRPFSESNILFPLSNLYVLTCSTQQPHPLVRCLVQAAPSIWKHQIPRTYTSVSKGFRAIYIASKSGRRSAQIARIIAALANKTARLRRSVNSSQTCIDAGLIVANLHSIEGVTVDWQSKPLMIAQMSVQVILALLNCNNFYLI
jgi:hypothetical protein